MHTGTLTAPVTDKPPSTVNYLSAFNSTSTQSTGLYLTPKTEYPIINESHISNGAACYQTNLYSYSNQNSFNNTANCTTNSYDQAAINRRKNATRETTNTLKAWLYEHRKNPYPTKGEKIMLAIITKMTLTQVSTWFANARRRLKKENKMTWEPRNKCSNSGDEEDSSDIEYASNENENDMNRTATILNNKTEDSKSKRSDLKIEQKDDEMNGDDQIANRTNKCDDSDSNTSSNFKRNTSPPAFDSSNNYGKNETTTNYSTPDSNYANLENHHDRFFPYQRNNTTANEQLQFSYPSNRAHNVYGHITYSSSIQIPPVSNLTYVQSQMNETSSIYNQIHTHHYHNVHQTASHQNATNSVVSLPATAAVTTAPPNLQQHLTQQTNANNLQQPSSLLPTSSLVQQSVGQQASTNPQQESLQHTHPHHHSVYHHVPSLNAHSNYSLLQSTYPTDYMLAHHTHPLHQTNNQQTSLYYPAPPPPPPPLPTTTTLTQLSTQVQSNNVGNLRTPASDTNPYTNHLSLVKSTVNSLGDQQQAAGSNNKSDENNNLENNSNTANSSTLDPSNQMNSSTLENTRKIWSLAQTATDSHSIMSSNTVALSQDGTATVDTSAATYTDPTVDSTSNNHQQLVKDHHSPSIHNISTYMSGHSSDSSLNGVNNQLTNYSNNTLHHQNYPIDCGQLTHNSNTFLGKVFFDYISTGTAGPLEHHDRNWTRIGLL